MFYVGYSTGPWDGPEGQAPLNPHSNQGINTFIAMTSDPIGATDVDTDADSDSDTDPPPDIGDWLCNPSYFNAGDGCDCGCGMEDPDCDQGTGCFTPLCYEEACIFCHAMDGLNMPCIPPGPKDTCPVGDIDGLTSISCLPSHVCEVVPEDHYSIELEYACPEPEDVCCLLICDT